jgi:hypothetical protein
MSRRQILGACPATSSQIWQQPWLLAPGETPPLAAHVVTSRRGYTHHGIYVGNGSVVHYAGFARSWRTGPVEKVSLAQFAAGRPVWVRPYANPRFDRIEVVARASSRLGEDCYRILSNNCEHFCEWCIRGEHRSRQIEAWRALPRQALHTAIALMARWFSEPVTAANDDQAWGV